MEAKHADARVRFTMAMCFALLFLQGLIVTEEMNAPLDTTDVRVFSFRLDLAHKISH